jgi:2-dehydropantoate 2-reductase
MAEAKLRIGILGAGAIGTMLACLLERAGYEAVCIVKEDQVSTLTTDGLTFESERFGTIQAHPLCESALSRPVGALLVTVKSPYLREALNEISPAFVSDGVVISLLNGIGAVEILRDMLSPHALLGTIGSVEVESVGVGKVRQIGTLTPHVEIAGREGAPRDIVEAVARALSETGMTVNIGKTESEVLWGKLVRLNAIASVTAFSGKTVGEVRNDPQLFARFIALVTEGIAIAEKDGAVIAYDPIMALTAKMPDKMTTSLERDIEKGAASELETITGGVLKKAHEHGVLCPVLEETYALLLQKTKSGITKP